MSSVTLIVYNQSLLSLGSMQRDASLLCWLTAQLSMRANKSAMGYVFVNIMAGMQ